MHTVFTWVTLTILYTALCQYRGISAAIYLMSVSCNFDVVYLCTVKARGQYAILGALCCCNCTSNSFPDAHLVPIELILCIMEKIVLSPIWCEFIRNKMSIKDELIECSCTENRIVVHYL